MMHATGKRWFKRIGIVLAVLIVLLIASGWWLLGTESGLHFALARVTNDNLSVKAARGHLAGPLQLDGVRYRNPDSGLDASIRSLRADPELWSLFAGTLHFRNLDATGVKVVMTTPAQPPPESDEPLSLKPPLDIVLDKAHLQDIDIIQNGQSAFRANTLDVAGAWTSRGLDLKELKLRSPDGRADLSGQLALSNPFKGNGAGSFQWTVSRTTYAGKLETVSNGKHVRMTLSLSSPMQATLHVDMQQSGDYPWTARLAVPAFDPKAFLEDSSIKKLAVALDGHGDRHGGTLDGQVGLDKLRFRVHPLTIHYNADKQHVLLDQLVLTSPDIKGELVGHGTVDLADKPMQADLALNWHDVLVPESVAGQKLASGGDITIQGGADNYHVNGRMQLGPPDQLAHLTLDLAGTPDVVTLKALTVEQPKGGLTVQGKLDLKPHLGWDLTAKGQNFNPGLMLTGWDGAMNLAFATQGEMRANGPEATLKLDKLDGTLRHRPLSGHGDLHVTPDRVLTGKLSLASGNSRLSLDGTGTERNHITLKMAIASLNDWMPDASGSMNGHFLVTGLWPELAVKGHLSGQKLVVSDTHVGKVALDADVPDISHPGGKLTMQADRVMTGGLLFETVTLDGHGNESDHALKLTAEGKPLSLQMALSGHMKGKAWNGTLSTLNLDIEGLPRWRLQSPSQLAWNQGKASISRTCLTAGEPVLCLTANQARNQSLDADYTLHAFPLALIATFVGNGMPLHAEGVINGEGKIHRDAAGALTGQATLSSPSGKISYPDRPDLPLLAYRDFNAHATLAPQDQHITLSTAFTQGGNLHGDIRMRGPQKALSGQISVRMDSLAPITLFTDMLANVKGHLDGDFQLGGTLDQPDITGNATVHDFAAEVPAVGLKLHDGEVNVATAGNRRLQLDGHVGSGTGVLQLGGSFAGGDARRMHITLKGDNVEAANIPAAKVVVSPDLAIEQNAEGLHLTGSVGIDSADIKLENLPGAGATQASPDVVVVDDNKEDEQQSAVPISADITVDLGDKTNLEGYGLDGSVSGRLAVHQVPGKPATGRGQITINGTYRAYGQDLVIKQGRLLFASTPIDNPGLNIRAVRILHPNATISDNEEVGLLISGTARHPVMTVFSNPTMEQSDALSYLITGKPLSQVKGGEGNMVNAAAQALGSATGDLLAKGIGSKLGINAGVTNSEALGTAAFTVGKYLSPRLYLSYGVGLFDPGQVISLRYILDQHWNFEAEQATTFSRASFNYRIEK